MLLIQRPYLLHRRQLVILQGFNVQIPYENRCPAIHLSQKLELLHISQSLMV